MELVLAKCLSATVVFVHIVKPHRYRELYDHQEDFERARIVWCATLPP